MSSKFLDKIGEKISENSNTQRDELSSFYLKLSVPFSSLIKNNMPKDIYTGEESIPFENKDNLFKSILRKEFSNSLKEFVESFSSMK